MSGAVNTEAGYRTEVGQIEAPMIRLCTQLKPLMEEGRYGLIVGEDVSGRIPALIVQEFSDEVALRTGQDKTPIVFVTNKRRSIMPSAEEIVEHEFRTRVLPTLSGKEGKRNRALIVTDWIDAGNTLNALLAHFTMHSIPFDVAVLRRSPGHWNPLALQDESVLLIGEEHVRPPVVFQKPQLTGFSKETPSSSKDRLKPYVRRFQPRQKVLGARKDVELIVRKVVAQVYPDSQHLDAVV